MPYRLREEIAEVLIYDLLSGKGYEIKDEKRFMEKFGVFYPIFLSMRNQQVWEEIKILAGANRMAGFFLLKSLLEELFTLLDDYEKVEQDLFKKSPRGLEKTLKSLKDLINETQAIWEQNRLERTESLKYSDWQKNLNELQDREKEDKNNQRVEENNQRAEDNNQRIEENNQSRR